MASKNGHMPKPSAALFVTGILIQALLVAFRAKQRGDFTAALVSICDTQEAALEADPSKATLGIRNGTDKELAAAIAWWRSFLGQDPV